MNPLSTRLSLTAAMCLLLTPAWTLRAQQSESLTLFDFWRYYSDAPNAFYKNLVDDALEALDRRDARVARLQTARDWEQRRDEVRQTLMEVVGPFPEKTPLNARTLSVHRGDGFTLENVVYESLPGFPVSASLFIPDERQDPSPAIIYCSGHSVPGYRSNNYQHMILNLVRKGFIVLAFDPIGQGERLQYYDPELGRSKIGRSSSVGHSYAGAQSFIMGVSLARHMIWDGIRTVDYLFTRGEVDPARLGITGRSGGGTQSAYIAAFDDRILASAPECYLTTFRRLLVTRGPQDAEQNFYRGIASGIDQADLLIARAPKPTLIVATTRDIFSFEGTLELFEETRRAYRALGRPEAVQLTEDDEYHAPTRKNREALYAFFQETLGVPGDPRDEDITPLDLELVRVTPTGQVSTSGATVDVSTLNRRTAESLMDILNRQRTELSAHLPRVRREAARLSGHGPLANKEKPIFAGRYLRDEYFIEKYLLPVDDRYAVPVLIMVPESGVSGRVILYLHPDGKATAAEAGGTMEALVRKGHAVIAPDVSGIGELGPGYMHTTNWFSGIPLREWFGFVQMGRSIVGMQGGDILRAVELARERFDARPEDLFAIAHDTLAPALLHAAAIDGVFAGTAMVDPLLSYRAVATTRYYNVKHLPSIVPGALTAYDLPDLAAALVPRRLLMINVADAAESPATSEVLDIDLAVVRAAYARQPAPSFSLRQNLPAAALASALEEWLD